MIKDVYEEKNTRYYKNNLPPPIVKHKDGSIIVWACFSADSVGNIHKIGGNNKFKRICKNFRHKFGMFSQKT